MGNVPSTGKQSNMHAPENAIEQELRRGEISPPEGFHGANSCRLNGTMQKGYPIRAQGQIIDPR